MQCGEAQAALSVSQQQQGLDRQALERSAAAVEELQQQVGAVGGEGGRWRGCGLGVWWGVYG